MKQSPILRSRSALTLIELIAVIAIIGILAVILIPIISSVRSNAHTVQCVSNLRQIGSALLQYAADNDGKLPYRAGHEPHWSPLTIAADLVGNYGEAGYLPWSGKAKGGTERWTDIMLCPSDPNRSLYENSNNNFPSSYMYRQNVEAGAGGTQIVLNGWRSDRQEGYLRWLVMDRAVHGDSNLVKPYRGIARSMSEPTHWWEPDRRSYSSYWHKEGTHALYEDGSVSFRYLGETIGK